MQSNQAPRLQERNARQVTRPPGHQVAIPPDRNTARHQATKSASSQAANISTPLCRPIMTAQQQTDNAQHRSHPGIIEDMHSSPLSDTTNCAYCYYASCRMNNVCSPLLCIESFSSLGSRLSSRHILQHVSYPALGRHAPLLFAHRKELRYETVSWRALGLRILE